MVEWEARSEDRCHDLRKLEYDNLCKEILDGSTKIYQVVALCSGGVAAVLSYSVVADASKFPIGAHFFPFALLLMPFLLIYPSIVLVESSLRSTTRIAGYLAVYHELPCSGLNWQIVLQRYRMDPEAQKHRSFKLALITVFTALEVGTFLCSIFSVVGIPELKSLDPRVSFGRTFYWTYGAVSLVLAALYFWLSRDLSAKWGGPSFERQREIFQKLMDEKASDKIDRANST